MLNEYTAKFQNIKDNKSKELVRISIVNKHQGEFASDV